METLQYPTETKAIKVHRCDFCTLPIEKGHIYLKSSHKYEGSVYTWKAHLNCQQIAQKLKMFEDCEDGVTADEFNEIISDHYHVITGINPDFTKPPVPFSERLELVFIHNGLIQIAK